MFSTLFLLVATVFRYTEPDEFFSLSGYEYASSIDSLIAKLQAELVPAPIAFPMKPFHMPPHVRKNTPTHTGESLSPNPAAVLAPRQTCTADNYCFANNPRSYCPDCGICCTQASGGWCCAQTGTFAVTLRVVERVDVATMERFAQQAGAFSQRTWFLQQAQRPGGNEILTKG
jgi:hypothetical protein